MRRIVVVGGLAAGPAAAARAARQSPGAEVTLVEAGPHIAYGVCELPDRVAGLVTEPERLTPWSAAAFEKQKGVRVLTGTRATAIDPGARRVALEQPGGAFELAYDALVLATGSRPRRPAIGAARVLKTPADAEHLRQAALRARGGRAAVLGAGYIGLLVADALLKAGLAVTVFEREALPLAGFEPEHRQVARAALERSGIELQSPVEVRTGVVEGADLVVAALGADPEVELARAARIELGASGALRVDERLETSVAAVFACGDCIELEPAAGGAPAPIALASIANRTGRVAGANAAGAAERLAGANLALAFRALGIEFARTGLDAARARALGLEVLTVSERSRSRAAILPGGTELLVTLVVERSSGRLLGANLSGGEGAALRLQLLGSLVARGARVEELERTDLAYAPCFSPLVDPVLVAAARASRLRR
jgi:NADPH-dependent 2,4-dienoyl-CoA reductase/sulfur reductase-like enzyme